MTAPAGDQAGDRLVELVAVMSRLRAECAWKAGQTHTSLAKYLLEETHEVLEAIDTGDREHLREELGDLLLQIYFHAEIAAEDGAFTIDDVAADLTEKLVRRNPHVFGPDVGQAPTDPVAINEAWEAIKGQEKKRASVLDGLPPTLPALLLAEKVLDRSERAGTGPPPSPADAPGTVSAEEIGDQLLALVARARVEGVDPEQSLRHAVRRRAADA